MSDNPELPPASQTGDDHREIEIEARAISLHVQETGADDDTSKAAYGQPDRESLRVLQSLSPRNSLVRHDLIGLRCTGEGPAHTNDHAVQDVNMAVATLSSSQEDLAQSNSGDRESTTSSSVEPERKPVEATDTPTGGTSALVPSSSPPKSPQYLDNMAELLNTFVMVDIPTPASIDPADQHRDFDAMQSIEGIIKTLCIPSLFIINLWLFNIHTGVSLCSVLRDKTVKTISKTLFLPNSELPLHPFIVDNTNLKVCCSLHPLGLGNDRMGHNKSMTVTSAIHLPRVNSTCTNLLNESHCTIILSVSVYKSIYDGEIKIGHSSASQRITDEDRKNRRVHMVIHHVASQDDIVFKTVSDRIGFKIKIRIEAG